MKQFFLSLLTASILISCGGNNSSADYRPGSTGNPYEAFVVATAEQWNGALGDTLRAVIGRDVRMLNRPEPEFDLRFVPRESINNLINKHRNLLIVKINDTLKQTKISADFNIKSEPQVLLYLNSPSEDSLAQYIHENGDQIIEYMNNLEMERFTKRMLELPATKVNQLVDSMFGIQISIPRGYTVRNTLGDDFAWISYELPQSSQGIVIYSYPYEPDMEFSGNSIVQQRDIAVSNIPGPSADSYMTTSKVLDVEVNKEMINGRTWVVTRGFWDVAGDYMGGPFTSYSTVDKSNGRVLVIDNYVYSLKPSKGRRNFLRQLEAVVRTVKFK